MTFSAFESWEASSLTWVTCELAAPTNPQIKNYSCVINILMKPYCRFSFAETSGTNATFTERDRSVAIAQASSVQASQTRKDATPHRILRADIQGHFGCSRPGLRRLSWWERAIQTLLGAEVASDVQTALSS